MALPPDLLGSVTADNKSTLSVDFVWTGPGPVPTRATFLLLTHLTVDASVNYGTGGATSGVSATAKAKLPDQNEAVAASAGDAGSNSQPPLNGEFLLRVTPNGNVATVSIKGEVEADTLNSLAYASWQDSPALPGSGEHGTYYYSGKGNGETGANASATISATAQVAVVARPINFRIGTRSDGTPDVDILDDGELTFHYVWDSSTGRLSDLDESHCMVYEHVTYAGNSTGQVLPDPFTGVPYYYPPDPFDFRLQEPTQLGVPGSDGKCADDQRYGTGDKSNDFSTPYKAASFTGIQNFFYHSDDLAPGDFPVLLGPLTITRSVYHSENNPNDWFYDVSKDIYSSTLSLSF